MWSKRASGGTLSYFIWTQRVSEQIDARVGGVGAARGPPGVSRRESRGAQTERQQGQRSGPGDRSVKTRGRQGGREVGVRECVGQEEAGQDAEGRMMIPGIWGAKARRSRGEEQCSIGCSPACSPLAQSLEQPSPKRACCPHTRNPGMTRLAGWRFRSDGGGAESGLGPSVFSMLFRALVGSSGFLWATCSRDRVRSTGRAQGGVWSERCMADPHWPWATACC